MPYSGAADGAGDLSRAVRELQERVARLERCLDLAPEAAAPEARPPSLPAAAPSASAILPLIGRSLLGLAGAYLLRVLTEGRTLTVEWGVAAGLLYAMAWLLWAARTPAERRMESALASVTSVLILAPLLWEATLRFHAVNTWTAGGILLVFTVFGMAISWRKNLLITATIATLAGVGCGAAMLVATHDALPFTFVLLAMAAAVEACACLDHWLSERWLAALAADLAVLLATWLVTNGRGMPPAWNPLPTGWLLAAQAGLVTIYLASVIFRTLVRGRTFTSFETMQCAFAFLIGVGGGLRLSRDAAAIAAIALACAVACYAVAFARLDLDAARSRNFYTYSSFGILLALSGSRILLSGAAATALWAALALACVWAGGHFDRITLNAHGAAYLLLSLIGSGAFRQSAEYLLGYGLPPGLRASLWIGAAAAVASYGISAWRGPARGRIRRSCRLSSAASAVWLLAGIADFAVAGGYHAVFGMAASHAYCATLRTAVLVSAALAAAWIGARLDKRELTSLIYPLMAIAAYRMLAQDLRQDRTAALFFSLLVFGAALTALPRLGRRRIADGPHPG